MLQTHSCIPLQSRSLGAPAELFLPVMREPLRLLNAKFLLRPELVLQRPVSLLMMSQLFVRKQMSSREILFFICWVSCECFSRDSSFAVSSQLRASSTVLFTPLTHVNLGPISFGRSRERTTHSALKRLCTGFL